MGNKGDKQTNASAEAAEKLQASLISLGDIHLRKMFGGHGIFMEDKMFALVDGKGTVFFKADGTNVERYEEAGAPKHGRMPYYQVPNQILTEEKTLQEWAQSSIDIAKKGKNRGG